jgi:C-terminal peptidase prc
MSRPLRRLIICCVFLLSGGFRLVSAVPAEGTAPEPLSAAPRMPPDLVKRVGEITDAVLANHADPPVRQEMILSGMKALYLAAKVPAPAGLSRRVSAVSTPEQIAALLAEIWPKSAAKSVTQAQLETAMVNGMLTGVPGGASLMSAKESAVMEQFEGNRYVGIHIALGMNKEENCPSIHSLIEGGPADRAGVKNGDLIEMIDGVATKGMALLETVDRLRGQEGTSVTIKVRQPKESLVRTYTIRRGQHARSTVTGVRKQKAGDWDWILDASAPIAYLRVDTISASTPHDLRKVASQLASHGWCGVILDLRGVQGTALHPAVLLADSLLPGGVIGRVHTAERDVTYKADADALFRGQPMAVLVDQSTDGTAEWLAAALQDNKRATVVGVPAPGAASATQNPFPRRMEVRARVPVGDGSWTIELVTGYLVRGDGRLLGQVAKIANSISKAVTRFPNSSETTARVNPDHLVNPNDARSGRAAVPSRSPQGVILEKSLDADPVVQEAVRLLWKSLEKTI